MSFSAAACTASICETNCIFSSENVDGIGLRLFIRNKFKVNKIDSMSQLAHCKFRRNLMIGCDCTYVFFEHFDVLQLLIKDQHVAV